ncbi:polyprenyl synthetase family protein [Candidatus Woesearchaeota archaeon]|nr:polyprenyl synthetase family protein [Candidatus Woesearchaeota archaeon]
MPKHSLPDWSGAYSEIIDEAIEQLLQKARLRSSVDIFMPLIKSATKRGRKLRSSLVLRYLDWENFSKSRGEKSFSKGVEESMKKKTFSKEGEYDISKVTLLKEGEPYKDLLEGLSAIELLHSASCILDDIIDGDTQRRGVPSFHVREGAPEAQLVVLETVLLSYYINNPRIRREIIDATRLMLQGEACDSFPFEKFIKLVWQDITSRDRTSQDRTRNHNCLLDSYVLKTAPSFAVSHKIIGIAYELSETETTALEKYGHSLGVFYQYANDYHDTFSISPDVRGHSSDTARVTLSMPLLIALSRENDYYNGIIGKPMPRSEISGLVQKMRDEGIEDEARNLLEQSKLNVLQNYPKLANNSLNRSGELLCPDELLCSDKSFCPDELLGLVDIISKSDFWSYSYSNM